MSAKLNLTYIKRTERISAKTNKPFTSLSIKATQYGDKFLSGFGNRNNENWKEGMEVEVAEVKEVNKDGKTYLNFEMPKAFGGNPETTKAIEEVKNSLSKLHLKTDEILAWKRLQTGEIKPVVEDYPPMDESNNASGVTKEDDGLDQIKPEDIPF